MKNFPYLISILAALFINACNKSEIAFKGDDSGSSKVGIVIVSAVIRFDTSIEVCATISNKLDTGISIFPPEFGAYLPTAQYGFSKNADTLWLNAATAMDYDTYPEIRIPKHSKYTFTMRPGYFELWRRGRNAVSDKNLAEFINSSEYISVRYMTSLIDTLSEKSDMIDSVSVRKYQRFKLESSFFKLSSRKSLCDTGVYYLSDEKPK